MVKVFSRKVLVLPLLLGLAAFLKGTSTARAADTLAQVGLVSFPAGNGSSCWGWTAPDNTEYAIMGYRNGIAIVRTTPTVTLIDTIPGPTGNNGFPWREMKTYSHYAYCVSEATGLYSGITVIDLQYLPDSAHYIGSFRTNHPDSAAAYTAHTISIDSATGFCYVEGTSTQKVRILSLANPEQPTFVTFFGDSPGSIHDMTAFNDTVYVAEGSAGTWSIWDVTNKAAPAMIVRVSIPAAGYVHNVWPSPDKTYCATTEETAGKTVKFWDISNLQNIQLVGQFLGGSGMAHNAHWWGDDSLVLAHYQSGVYILDVSNPALPTVLGHFDTYLAGESFQYAGCWGVYPYSQNGYIYASDLEGELTVLELRPPCNTRPIPMLQSPADGAADLLQPIALSWSNTGAVGYHVEVDSDPGFGSPDYDTVVTDTALSLSGLPLGITYLWRVSSQDDCGFGPPSTPRSFETGCIVLQTGDVDVSGAITSGDIVYLVNYVFKLGATPMPIEAAGDVNCSSLVDLADIIHLVNFTFKSGAAPCNVCTIL